MKVAILLLAAVTLSMGAGLNIPSTFTTDFVSKGKGPSGTFLMMGTQYSSEEIQFSNGNITINNVLYGDQFWTYFSNKTSYLSIKLGCQKLPATITYPVSYYNPRFVSLDRTCFDTKGNRPGNQWKFQDEKTKISMVMCVSKDKTTPYFGMVDVDGISQTITYRNFVAGVKDTSVFNLGEQCWNV